MIETHTNFAPEYNPTTLVNEQTFLERMVMLGAMLKSGLDDIDGKLECCSVNKKTREK